MNPNPPSQRTVGVWLVCYSLMLFPGSGFVRAQSVPDPQTVKSFFAALRQQDTNTVFTLLESHTNLANAPFAGRLPLHVAASLGPAAVVDRLLKGGADINAQGDTLDTSNVQLTALEAAIEYGQTNCAKVLLAAGADPNLQSPFEGGALHCAFSHRHPELAGQLLEAGADPFRERTSLDRVTPFELAITSGDGTGVPRMLAEGQKFFAAPKPRNYTRPAPDGHLPPKTLAEFLAARGVPLLTAAATRGEVEAVMALLEAGVSPRQPVAAGPALMQTAALAEVAAARKKGYDPEPWRKIRSALLEHGATDDVFAATARGDAATVRKLTTADPGLAQARDSEGATPLFWAVQNDRLPLTTFWLQAGAAPAATNAAGQTALHLAAAQGLAEQLQVLLAAHAPTDVRDTNRWTPLDAATQARQAATIRLLLNVHPETAPADRAPGLPIHEAAARGNLTSLLALTETTNQLEARNELGLTPLQVAVQHGHLAAAALLVDKGADIRARDADGNPLLLQILLQDRLTVYDRPTTNWVAQKATGPHREEYLGYLTVGPYEQGPNPVLQATGFLLLCGADAAATNRAGQTALQLVAEDKVSPGIFFFDDDRTRLLKLLAAQGANVNQSLDAEGNTPLHLVGADFDTDRFDSLVTAGADLNATNNLGQTPLHKYATEINAWSAVESGTPFQALVNAKPNINARDNAGRTPLSTLAATASSFKAEAAGLLLTHGADPNVRDNQGRTAAHLGLDPGVESSETVAFMQALVKAGADLSLRDNAGKTPLHYLAATQQIQPLFFLRGIDDLFAAAKVDVNVRDDAGDTPLHLAARAGNLDIVDWLVKLGADLDATNNTGATPRQLAAHQAGHGFARESSEDYDLFEAIRRDNREAVERLLQSDATLANETNHFGQTPLYLAIVDHHTNLVELLVQHGVQWDETTAVLAGQAEILNQLLHRHPDALTTHPYGPSWLPMAVDNGDAATVQVLLAAQADVTAADFHGLSPLGHALLKSQPELVELLRQHGARENFFDAVYTGDAATTTKLLAKDKTLAVAVNKRGLSGVTIAAGLGRTKILQLLLDHGATATPPTDRDGRTPLDWAAFYNQTATAEMLLQHGAPVNAPDPQGLTALHWAALNGAADTLALLLKHQANPDAPAELPSTPPRRPPFIGAGAIGGNTALHFAALNGQTNVIELLLRSGAAVNAPNDIGSTPLDLASPTGLGQGSPWAWENLRAFLDPTKIQPLPFATLKDRRAAAAAMLEAAGGKQTERRQTMPSPVGRAR